MVETIIWASILIDVTNSRAHKHREKSPQHFTEWFTLHTCRTQTGIYLFSIGDFQPPDPNWIKSNWLFPNKFAISFSLSQRSILALNTFLCAKQYQTISCGNGSCPFWTENQCAVLYCTHKQTCVPTLDTVHNNSRILAYCTAFSVRYLFIEFVLVQLGRMCGMVNISCISKNNHPWGLTTISLCNGFFVHFSIDCIFHCSHAKPLAYDSNYNRYKSFELDPNYTHSSIWNCNLCLMHEVRNELNILKWNKKCAHHTIWNEKWTEIDSLNL